MVKVCNFGFFNEQRILSPKTGEPLAIACSDDHLFVAEEGCVLEVYPFTSEEPIAQLRTVSPVVQILYNPCGDCIVTLERKHPTARMFARVYFKWRESTIDRPMRVSLISSLTQGLLSGVPSVTAEINELPADETMSVNCVAVCKKSGRIAMGMDSRIRLFTLTPIYESGCVTSHSIEILLDVETGVTVRKVDVFSDYLAFISACEVRVLKLSLLTEGTSPIVSGGVAGGVAESEESSAWESDQTIPIRPRPPKVQLIDRAKETSIRTDGHFVSWSPSKVWEDERLSASNSLSTSLNLSHDLEPHPLYDRLRPPQGSQHIETLTLPAITMATQERTAERHPVEVLGPVEYVWGQPVGVWLDGATPTTRCRLLTMLYRRFSLSQIEGDKRRGVTQSLPPKGSGRGQEEWGLHTVELVPVTIHVEDSPSVIGVSCFVGGRLHGYLYDVATKARLVSSFSFTSETSAVASDGMLFHALSQGTVETFSNRAMQVALSNRHSTDDGGHSKWLKQPCPSPNMDLTLMSSNKLIGGCCLATSRDYLVVLTKSREATPTNAGIRLLQSLRRPTAEPTWNIYILLKKDPFSLYQQFVEYADAIRETSLPMYQHVISEGHVLLRNQLLQNNALTLTLREQLEDTLAQNCFSLADSLCSDTRGPKVVTSIAAKYLILSGVSVDRVVQHITSQYTQEKCLPYQILLKYLSLVLGGEEVKGQLDSSAHTVLDLYTRHRPKQLSHILLTSPLRHLAPDHGLSLLSQHLQGLQSGPVLFKGQLCSVILLLQLKRRAEAKDVLKLVSEEFLVDWLRQNMSVVMETDPLQLTDLGMLLWSHWESTLLELLTETVLSGQLTLEQLLSLVKVPGESLADNTLLKALLERVVLRGGSHDNRLLLAALQLVDLLLTRLVSTQVPRPPSATPFSLYGNRHKWLDSLPPFDGSQPPAQTVLQDLMQLQALLCSAELLPVSAIAKHTLTQLSGCGQQVVGHLSLQLLTWPHVGKLKEAIVLALEVCPVVTVELCMVYLPSELDSWRDLLSLLLQQLLPTPDSLLHQTLYKAALEHVVGMTTPEEFLSLLPSDGALHFFLPFIESSLHQYVARQLGERLNQNSAR